MSSSFTTTPPQDLTVRLTSRQSAVAVALLFAVNGLIIGGFGGVLPSIRERLDINATHIATMLFTAGLAGIVGMQVGGRLSDAIGARRVALAGLPLLIAAAATFAFSTTFPVAVVGAVLLGLPRRRRGSGAARSRQRKHGRRHERCGCSGGGRP
jgi:predicted MFS family arabinose efflux permease